MSLEEQFGGPYYLLTKSPSDLLSKSLPLPELNLHYHLVFGGFASMNKQYCVVTMQSYYIEYIVLVHFDD